MSEPRNIDFFFDIGSPYSYLAATQVEALEGRTGAKVCWRPLLLGALFKSVGNEMPARVPSKARYMIEDLARWAQFYAVPFRMSSHFPVNSLKPQRALTAAAGRYGDAAVGPLALALYQAYWVDDRDPSTPEVLLEAAASVGQDGAALLTDCDLQETKDALRSSTEEAVQRGAFGAPTFFVGEAMFWGNDRIALLEAYLATLPQ